MNARRRYLARIARRCACCGRFVGLADVAGFDGNPGRLWCRRCADALSVV